MTLMTGTIGVAGGIGMTRGIATTDGAGTLVLLRGLAVTGVGRGAALLMTTTGEGTTETIVVGVLSRAVRTLETVLGADLTQI